jgi:hypothetical protein
MDGVSGGHANRLSIAAIAVLAYHLAFAAELLTADLARRTRSTGYEVVEAHPISDLVRSNPIANLHDSARHFVPRSNGPVGLRGPGPIVNVGMADPCGFHTYDDIFRTWSQRVEMLCDQWPARLLKSNGLHCRTQSAVVRMVHFVTRESCWTNARSRGIDYR